MAEVLVRFTDLVQGPDGRNYQPQACGTLGADGLWDGWIEFVSPDRSIRTERETSQPNRADLMYWAQGLTHAYLEGAVTRALAPPPVIGVEAREPSIFDGPAPAPLRRPVLLEPHAILDPFAVYTQGEHVLRRQLLALSPDQLSNVIVAYRLGEPLPVSVTTAEVIRRVDETVAVVRQRSRAA
jgi:hypothetical protein